MTIQKNGGYVILVDTAGFKPDRPGG